MSYYAVAKGRQTGIFTTWNECLTNINKYPNAKYKKFKTQQEAQEYLDNYKNQIDKNQIDKNEFKKSKKYEVDDDIQLKEKNKKLPFVYHTNYSGYMRPLFRQNDWKKYFYIFTDGSKRNNPKLKNKSGFGVYVPKNINYNYYGANNFTNNYNEIKAILKALETILDLEEKENQDRAMNRQFIIVSDSMLSINIITKWMETWKLNGWVKMDKKPIANLELIKNIDKLLYKIDQESIALGFMHVRSHLKEPSDVDSLEYFLWFGNNCVDKIARGENLPKARNTFKYH